MESVHSAPGSTPATVPASGPRAESETGLALDAAFHRTMRALFYPERVAIVGATPQVGFAFNIHRNILNFGFQGEVYGVNPKYQEVLGSACYPTLDAIPHRIDQAIIVVPSHAVLGVLEQAERAGVTAVNIITSGFGEQDDEQARQRQVAIREFARRTGIRVVGPNCLGLVSTPARLVAKSGPYTTVARGPISLVFQSGLLTYSMIIPPQDREIGFTYVVTTGNEADLEAADFMRFCVEDEQTRVIGCFIEQFRDPQKLLQVAEQAADAGKPIVVLKVGRSEGGRRAALAHTGSLVGSDEVIDAVMRQYGLIRVSTLDEMIETLAAFHSKRLPKGPGVGTIFVSGGAGGLISDLCQDLGVSLPALAPETVARLKPVIPPYGTVGNPLDTTGQAATQPEITEGSLVAMAEDPSIHTVVYGQAYPNKIDLDSPVGRVIKSMPERYPDKVFLVLSLVTGKMHDGSRWGQPPVEPVTHWDGVPFLQGAENGLRAIGALIRYADFLRARQAEPRPHPEPSAVAEQARALVRASGGRPLVEREAKTVLSLYGIPVTRERLATSPEEALVAAREIGYPVVLKVESPDIAHKTEAGGVLLGVTGEDAVRQGFARIVENARRHAPGAKVAGVLVQEMAAGGRELIVGMTVDPAFGPAIAVGLGGIFVELLRDVALGVPPLTRRDCRAMLARLRAAPVLETGARGTGPADLDAVVDILIRFSQLCIDLQGEVSEIDINPLVVFERGLGAKVVDCLIVPAKGAR
ncbi:acetate--CoA ligase family protein [Thermomicrobiaceae bacterium CFH 74404]|uniref:Acetate--CoA ligase family protein n=1 Tax=Thermalbibacter longus TaxID=2951981 RepID=A0AA42BBT8_9BACT|nr:acetate--CoA ligase family protein [Thermalbibacter longus]MCM8748128.1 acetate--CoA ligase family protein [Thermalbibacter longus]